jgi:hypothetical protein
MPASGRASRADTSAASQPGCGAASSLSVARYRLPDWRKASLMAAPKPTLRGSSMTRTPARAVPLRRTAPEPLLSTTISSKVALRLLLQGGDAFLKPSIRG